MQPLYDSHNHLQKAELRAHWLSINETLQSIGLKRMIVNGTHENDWADVLSLAQEHSTILPSLGLHPWFVNDATQDWKQTLGPLIKQSTASIAIGEIGLDKWIKGYDLKKQIDAFTWQLSLAVELNAPVTIHCLKAWGTLYDILKDTPLPQPGFLLHSYSGPIEMVERFAALGAYFSFSGYFAHERKTKQQDVFKIIPTDRLLVETDAPDMLPPSPLIEHPLTVNSDTQKSINHPANIKAIYTYLANLRKTEMDSFCQQVEKNFNRLFN